MHFSGGFLCAVFLTKRVPSNALLGNAVRHHDNIKVETKGFNKITANWLKQKLI